MYRQISRSPVAAPRLTLDTRPDLPRWAPAATLAVALAAALLAQSVAAGAAHGIELRPVADTLAVVATALFFGAGMLRYTRWTVTGEPYAAAGSAALLVFAVSTVPMALAARTMVATSASSAPASLIRLVAVLAVGGLLAPVLGIARVDRAASPGRLAGVGLLATVAGFALAAVADRLEPAFDASVRVSAGLDSAAAAVWLALAGLSLGAGREERSSSARWSALVMVMLSVAGLVRATAADSGRWSWAVAVGALMLLAGLVSVVNAGLDAREVLAARDRALQEASDALVVSERLLLTVESRRADLIHDARSMIYVLRAGLAALDRDGARADPDGTRRLRSAMDAELARLNRLIDGAGDRTLVEFDIAEVVAPLAETVGRQGVTIRCDVAGLRALGRPDDLAEMVANLLANARRHAAGTEVLVHGAADGDRTVVFIDDGGPGIPEGLRDVVFERGAALGPTGGTGLGLHLARRLARAQDGDLTVGDRPGGGARFVVSLRSPGSGACPDP